MSDNICASIAYCLDTSKSGFGEKAVGGYTLLKPLYVLATASFRTTTRNSWIIEQCEKISEHHGIPQAKQMAQTLRVHLQNHPQEDDLH
ncbi:hypothetical protein K469DRAFT_316130 [Zopfia rhizophila CBS 207.26]|uniref:Uncharacterized protein n=1 Tax=Zopfia rhizophila CBS 207.26 TaxID=1314779 RepID=A0A6A6ERF9_9PEZI|nr:hypothetical protein K469DRAFT_316130 [Zopfia rhizophila CBS 207.26]